jgi:hypothetical protein
MLAVAASKFYRTVPLALQWRASAARHPGTPATGINLAIFSQHGARVTLLLFDDARHAAPTMQWDLDSRYHRSGDI